MKIFNDSDEPDNFFDQDDICFAQYPLQMDDKNL